MSYDPAAWQIFEVHSHSGMRVSNDHHLSLPVVDMVTDTGEPAITQEIFKCVSRSVAGVCLQDLANRANQISVSN